MVGQGEAVEERQRCSGVTSLSTAAAALVSGPAGLSCYLAWDYMSCPVAQRQPNLCRALLYTVYIQVCHQGTSILMGVKATLFQYRAGERHRHSICMASSPCRPSRSAQTQGRTLRVEPSWHSLQSSSPHC